MIYSQDKFETSKKSPKRKGRKKHPFLFPNKSIPILTRPSGHFPVFIIILLLNVIQFLNLFTLLHIHINIEPKFHHLFNFFNPSRSLTYKYYYHYCPSHQHYYYPLSKLIYIPHTIFTIYIIIYLTHTNITYFQFPITTTTTQNITHIDIIIVFPPHYII